jgi:hypothetical protein
MPHGCPLPFLGWQMPAAQKLVPVHWASVVQLPLHCVGPQTKLPQLTVMSAGHAPAPLHPAGSVPVFVAASQLAARQFLVLSG